MTDNEYPQPISGGSGQASTAPSEPSILELLEESISQTGRLSSIVDELEIILNPICIDNRPEDSSPKQDSDMSRPDARINMVNSDMRRSTRRLEELLRRVNI